MKKTYLKPTFVVVMLQHQGIICTSDVRSVSGNAGIGYGGGGRGSARVRGSEEVDWDDYE